MLNYVVPVLKVVTVREAGNLGIFLRETLQMISYWRSSEQVWSEGVWGECVEIK